MRKPFTLLLVLPFLLASVPQVNADIWNGPSITFTRTAFADWTLPENQDWLTTNVALTRAQVMGIFNIAQENEYSNQSPVDTEWAYGTTADLGSLTFSTWEQWHGQNPLTSLNRDAVVHLISDDIYIDIRFTSWGIGGAGGGAFSYVRSTPGVIPEPSSGIFVLVVGGFAALRRRRR